jgi:hypothetical protein
MTWILSNWKLVSVILLLVGIEQYGEHRIQAKWNTDIAVRQAVLDKVKQDNQEALDASKTQYEQDKRAATSKAGRDAVNGYIRDHGLLQSCTGNIPAQGIQGTNGASEERGTSSTLESFTNDCGQDALKVIRWQDWCRANHCVVE